MKISLMERWSGNILFSLTDENFVLKTLLFYMFCFVEAMFLHDKNFVKIMPTRSILFPLHIFLFYVYLHTSRAKLTVDLPKCIVHQTMLLMSV